MLCSLLACGIDPDQCILFQQSSVFHHTTLSWILGSDISAQKLSHLPQFKVSKKIKHDFRKKKYINFFLKEK